MGIKKLISNIFIKKSAKTEDSTDEVVIEEAPWPENKSEISTKKYQSIINTCMITKKRMRFNSL